MKKFHSVTIHIAGIIMLHTYVILVQQFFKRSIVLSFQVSIDGVLKMDFFFYLSNSNSYINWRSTMNSRVLFQNHFLNPPET